MKYFILLFFTVFLYSGTQAQEIRNPRAIPALPNPNLNLPNITPEKKPSIFDVKPKNDAPDLWSDKSRVKFEKEEFANPADRYTKKMNTSSTEGAGDAKIFRRDQYFGDFKTKSETIKVLYRDPQAVDGDLLKVLQNDKIVINNIFLEGNFKTLEIKLVDGFNKLDFVALNEGQYFPNTGAFIIMDKGVQLYSSEWNMSTGFKASFIIVKE